MGTFCKDLAFFKPQYLAPSQECSQNTYSFIKREREREGRMISNETGKAGLPRQGSSRTERQQKFTSFETYLGGIWTSQILHMVEVVFWKWCFSIQ